jgi:hypothetical protein
MVGAGVVTGVETPSASPSPSPVTAASKERSSSMGWIVAIVVLGLLAAGLWRFSGGLRLRGSRRPPDPR